jgi:predicted Zn-dependent protease
LSRTQGNAAGAAAGFQDLAARFPQDETVQILAAESLIQDLKDYRGALAALSKIPVPPDTARAWLRYQLARADAYLGAGAKDSARLILEPISQKMPTNKRVQDRLAKAK